MQFMSFMKIKVLKSLLKVYIMLSENEVLCNGFILEKLFCNETKIAWEFNHLIKIYFMCDMLIKF